MTERGEGGGKERKLVFSLLFPFRERSFQRDNASLGARQGKVLSFFVLFFSIGSVFQIAPVRGNIDIAGHPPAPRERGNLFRRRLATTMRRGRADETGRNKRAKMKETRDWRGGRRGCCPRMQAEGRVEGRKKEKGEQHRWIKKEEKSGRLSYKGRVKRGENEEAKRVGTVDSGRN